MFIFFKSYFQFSLSVYFLKEYTLDVNNPLIVKASLRDKGTFTYSGLFDVVSAM